MEHPKSVYKYLNCARVQVGELWGPKPGEVRDGVMKYSVQFINRVF